ncbi:MAG: ankyrin repeat domain-containing protein [Helicobacteraceae bacterium]
MAKILLVLLSANILLANGYLCAKLESAYKKQSQIVKIVEIDSQYTRPKPRSPNQPYVSNPNWIKDVYWIKWRKINADASLSVGDRKLGANSLVLRVSKISDDRYSYDTFLLPPHLYAALLAAKIYDKDLEKHKIYTAKKMLRNFFIYAGGFYYFEGYTDEILPDNLSLRLIAAGRASKELCAFGDATSYKYNFFFTKLFGAMLNNISGGDKNKEQACKAGSAASAGGAQSAQDLSPYKDTQKMLLGFLQKKQKPYFIGDFEFETPQKWLSSPLLGYYALKDIWSARLSGALLEAYELAKFELEYMYKKYYGYDAARARKFAEHFLAKALKAALGALEMDESEYAQRTGDLIFLSGEDLSQDEWQKGLSAYEKALTGEKRLDLARIEFNPLFSFRSTDKLSLQTDLYDDLSRGYLKDLKKRLEFLREKAAAVAVADAGAGTSTGAGGDVSGSGVAGAGAGRSSVANAADTNASAKDPSAKNAKKMSGGAIAGAKDLSADEQDLNASAQEKASGSSSGAGSGATQSASSAKDPNKSHASVGGQDLSANTQDLNTSAQDPSIGAGAHTQANAVAFKTPLMYAAHMNNYGAVAALLEFSDVNASFTPARRCKYVLRGGRTALFYALENASAPVQALLVQAGADLNAKDAQGNGAAFYLSKNPYASSEDKARALEYLQGLKDLDLSSVRAAFEFCRPEQTAANRAFCKDMTLANYKQSMLLLLEKIQGLNQKYLINYTQDLWEQRVQKTCNALGGDEKRLCFVRHYRNRNYLLEQIVSAAPHSIYPKPASEQKK